MHSDYQIGRTEAGTELRVATDVLLGDGSTGRGEYTAEIGNADGEHVWQLDPASF